jgi:hypothetical protein
MSITLGRLEEIEEQRRAGVEPDYGDAEEAAEAERARQAMADLARRVRVQVVGDPARFVVGHKATTELASKLAEQAAQARQFQAQFNVGQKSARLLGARLAEQAAQARQFQAQFAGTQKFMKRQAEMGQAIIRQIAPIGSQLAAISSALKPALDQIAGLKLGMNVAQAAGLDSFKPVLERYRRAEQLLRERSDDAEKLLDQLDDVPIKDVAGPLMAIASSDRRQIRRETARLKARARRDPIARKLLVWVETAREYVLAAIDIARWLWCWPRREDEQWRPRRCRAVKRVGTRRRRPGNQARPPCRDMVKLLHAPRPPHASMDTQERRPILSVTGG